MALTPEDIESKKFLVGLRGYDKDEVTAFLHEVADDYRSAIDGAGTGPAANGGSVDTADAEARAADIIAQAEARAAQTIEAAEGQATVLIAQAEASARDLTEEAQAKRTAAEEAEARAKAVLDQAEARAAEPGPGTGSAEDD